MLWGLLAAQNGWSVGTAQNGWSVGKGQSFYFGHVFLALTRLLSRFNGHFSFYHSWLDTKVLLNIANQVNTYCYQYSMNIFSLSFARFISLLFCHLCLCDSKKDCPTVCKVSTEFMEIGFQSPKEISLPTFLSKGDPALWMALYFTLVEDSGSWKFHREKYEYVSSYSFRQGHLASNKSMDVAQIWNSSLQNHWLVCSITVEILLQLKLYPPSYWSHIKQVI